MMKKLFLYMLMLLIGVTTSACSSDSDTVPEPPVEEEEGGSTGTVGSFKVNIIVGNSTITATMEDNGAARDFMSRLPLEVTLEDYNNGTEKIFYPEPALGLDDTPRGCAPVPGDITIYEPWGNVAIFCREWSESGSLIKIGHINGDGINALIGTDDVRVRFERP